MCYITYTGLHQVTAFILHHGCNLITFQSTEHVCSGAAVGALYRFTLCVVHSWRLPICVIWYHNLLDVATSVRYQRHVPYQTAFGQYWYRLPTGNYSCVLLRAALPMVLVGCIYIATNINVTSVMYGLSMRGKYSVVSCRMKMYRIPFVSLYCQQIAITTMNKNYNKPFTLYALFRYIQCVIFKGWYIT